MISLQLVRQNPELIKRALQKRGVELDINKLLDLDEKKRELIKEVESLRAEKNKISKISLAGTGLSPAVPVVPAVPAVPTESSLPPSVAPADIDRAKQIKEELKTKERELEEVSKEFDSLFMLIPNIPFVDVPLGKNEEDNVVMREWGRKRQFDFKPKDHVELGKEMDLIDIERAVKISGSRFGILKNEAALLEFALVRLALDILLKEGFIPVIPPALIKPEAMEGMGYIDTDEDLAERYFLDKDKDGLFLVGTAEQAVGPMHSDEVFEVKELPKRYVAFSSCFREEAGSYGKDTKGIFRVHQFDKVEMFSFTKPDGSQKEHQYLISLQERLMKTLAIPYRVVQVCAGDLARPSAATLDIEAWIPSQERYREVQSSSNCTDFQARRLNIRYREASKTEFVHTLNATAFAIGRTIIAILENYQQKDGRILVPKALRKYLGFKHIPS